MNIFYHPTIPSSGIFELSEDESKHCVRVLRMTEGEQVKVLDGNGVYAIAEIINANPKRCSVQIISYTIEVVTSPRVHIAVAPTKNLDRMEWFVEKATEIGVTEISFIKCRFSERKEIKLERFHKIALAAIKQCNRYHLPKINEMASIDEFLAKCGDELKLMAYCPTELTSLLKDQAKTGIDTCVLIGPEGDFSPAEVENANKRGFLNVSLGKTRLRTETAALVACHTIILKNQ